MTDSSKLDIAFRGTLAGSVPSRSLPLAVVPVSVTVALFGGKLLVDPSELEAEAAEYIVVVVFGFDRDRAKYDDQLETMRSQVGTGSRGSRMDQVQGEYLEEILHLSVTPVVPPTVSSPLRRSFYDHISFF